MQVARRAADRLDQRIVGPQEALLVGIEDRDQRDLRHVEAFAQQVDAHQHVELAEAQVADDLGAFDGLHVGVQVAHPHVVLVQVFREVLRHALGERRDQHALVALHAQVDFGQHVIDLRPHRANLDFRIDEPGGTHHLLDRLRRMPLLVRPRRRGHEDHLRRDRLPFLELERPVVERRRQPEAVFDQRFLARPVAPVHRAELRDGLVAFVDDEQRIIRQIIVEARRRLAGRAARQVARVVLDARAVAHFLHHLHVEHRALLEPLRLEQLAGLAQLREAHAQVLADQVDRADEPLARCHVMRARINRIARHLARHLACERVEQRERFDRVIEQFDAHGRAIRFGGKDVDHVAAHAIAAGAQVELVARVLHVGEAAQELALVEAVAALQVQHHREIGFRIAEAVDRGHGRDDDRVAPLEQRLGGRQAHLLDVLVDRGVLLDVGIARRDVRFRLVVIVVRDEVLDGILREELAELAIELRGERLVVRDHERRPLHLRDDIRDRECLARAGDAEQRLVREAVAEPFDELRDGLRLIARGRVVRAQLKKRGGGGTAVHVATVRNGGTIG
ncbi:MAG: hypothetical protein CMLOHMNK_02006 [Steroidobacteraceae bacterium]|nr:hypothetical protein [Steroidobacteraceae bacterium]